MKSPTFQGGAKVGTFVSARNNTDVPTSPTRPTYIYTQGSCLVIKSVNYLLTYLLIYAIKLVEKGGTGGSSGNNEVISICYGVPTCVPTLKKIVQVGLGKGRKEYTPCVPTSGLLSPLAALTIGWAVLQNYTLAASPMDFSSASSEVYFDNQSAGHSVSRSPNILYLHAFGKGKIGSQCNWVPFGYHRVEKSGQKYLSGSTPRLSKQAASNTPKSLVSDAETTTEINAIIKTDNKRMSTKRMDYGQA